MRKLIRSLLFLPVLLLLGRELPAAWPTYRADAARSGYTPEPLPGDLRLGWTYAAQEPRPAWPRSGRLPFDRAYHPVMVEGKIYFGSSADHALYRLDAETGEGGPTFFTEGPIRFAPAVWKDQLFVASDDGHLYAFDLQGQLLWKHRGGPDHARRLGNEQMISKWPARGGPVVVGDVVYYAAGIWPTDGIYVYALDAATGKPRWVNDDSGGIYMPQPHGGADAESGVSAQGYLVAAGTQASNAPFPSNAADALEPRLLVATGRAVPASFDLDSGRFQYFHLQQYGKRGGTPTMAVGPLFFNSGIAFDTTSGQAGQTIGDGPLAAMPGGLLRATGKQVAAYEWVEEEKPDRRGKVERGWALKVLWTANNVDGGVSLIVAGDTVIAGGDGVVTLLDRSTGRVLRSFEVGGVAYGLAVSDRRLLVSTDEGRIYCFSQTKDEPTHHRPTLVERPYPDNSAIAAAAEEILRRSGVSEGYCFDFGCGDGQLAYELARRSKLRICAVETDAERVAQARARLSAAGLYGTRVAVHHVEDLAETGYPNYFANLIVSGRSVTEKDFDPPAREWQRCLRPYGGIALLGPAEGMKRAERGPLEKAGDWTHQYTNAANTLCSTDELVQGPLGMLWYRDIDVDMPQRHGRGPGPLFYDGRLYSEGLDELACVDAYNGRILWRYPLPGILKAYDGDELMGVAGTGSNYCVAETGIYVRRDDHCLRLDRVTGELLGKFTAPKQPDGKPGTWGHIACEDGILFGSLANRQHVVTYRYVNRGGDMSKLLTESMTVFAFDAQSAELKWRYDAEHSIRHNAIAVANDGVYVIDRPLALFDRTRTKTAEEHPPGVLVALDIDTGEIQWKNDQNIDGTTLAASPQHRLLLMSYQPTRFALASEIGGRMAVFSTQDGELRWEKKASYATRPLINDYTIYAQGGAWDLITGDERPFNFRRSYGCGILAGSKNMMLFRSATLGYFDLNLNERTENYGGMRPGCWINAIAAGGVVLVPDASAGCTCSYLNQAWFALEPMGPRPPKVEPDGGVFAKPVPVTLTAHGPGHEIRYTLDGSTPDAKSPLYQEPLTVSDTARLKARIFTEGQASRPADVRFEIDPTVVPLEDEYWRVWDIANGAVSGPSEWSVTGGVVTQHSNIYTGSAASSDPEEERYATLRIYEAGTDFTDGEIEFEIRSADDDGIGLAFRCRDEGHHYLWATDLQRGFRILAVKNGDSYRVLAKNEQSYQRNAWQHVRIVLDGPRLTVRVDGEEDFSIEDATFDRGTIALHSWGSEGVQFRGLRLRPKGS